MKKIFLILIFLHPSILINSQWPQIASINSPQLNCVKFFNQYTGITVGQGGNNGDKYTISISLPKENYKKYEPVIAKITLINKDVEPLSIYNLHNDYSNEPNFYIKDKLGHIYEHSNWSGRFLPYYTTDVLPGDTLVFSMSLNDWGKETSYSTDLSSDEIYFDRWGYFPEGDYTGYFFCNLKTSEGSSEKIISNEIAFKVLELSQEDKEVLKLYKQKSYDEVLNRYANNVFTEHVFRAKMLPYWNTLTETTETEYNSFIQKFPNSMYLYSWRFMLPYVKAAEQSHYNFESGIDYLLSIQGEESLAKESLANIPFTTIIKNYGKFIRKNK